MRVNVLVIPILLCLWSARVGLTATAYCVDSAVGRDTKPGTCQPYRPWASIGRVNQGPASPGGKYQPGDTIKFRGGQTFRGTLSFSSENSGGTNAQRAAMPMTITSYGDGRATISSGDGDGLDLTDLSGFRIDQINFAGTSLRNRKYSAYGIDFRDNLNSTTQLKNVIIDSVDVGGYGLDGVAFWVTSRSRLASVSVKNVAAHDNGDGGVLMCGIAGHAGVISNVYIGHVVTFNNPGIPEPYADRACGGGLGLGIYLLGVNNGMIEYSVAHDNGFNSPPKSPNCGPTSIMANVSNRITFQHNEVYHSRAGGCGIDGNAFSFESGVTNSVMQYNYAHDNDGTGLMAYNSYYDLVFRYNITENNARVRDSADLGIYGGKGPIMKDVLIYNNTIYASGNPSKTGAAVLVGSHKGSHRLEHIHLYNNIIYAANGIPAVVALDPQDETDLTFQGNDYWPAGGAFKILWGRDSNGKPVVYASLEGWRKATGQETLHARPVGFELAPELCDPGHGGKVFPRPLISLRASELRPDSRIARGGLNLPSLFGIDVGKYDFYGNPLPPTSTYSIGADEFQPGQTCSRGLGLGL